MIVAWILYILILLVALPACGVLFLILSLANAYYAAVICLALLGLWGYYQYFNIVRKNPLRDGRRKCVLALAGILFVCIVLTLMFDGGYRGLFSERRIQASDYNQALDSWKSANWIQKQMIPKGATDIDFYHRPGFWGSRAYLKCSCTMDALKDFEHSQGIVFQGESMFKNSASDRSDDINAIHPALKYFQTEDADRIHDIKSFLAYNCIHQNGGGFAFLYIIDSQILYAFYSSN